MKWNEVDNPDVLDYREGPGAAAWDELGKGFDDITSGEFGLGAAHLGNAVGAAGDWLTSLNDNGDPVPEGDPAPEGHESGPDDFGIPEDDAGSDAGDEGGMDAGDEGG